MSHPGARYGLSEGGWSYPMRPLERCGDSSREMGYWKLSKIDKARP